MRSTFFIWISLLGQKSMNELLQLYEMKSEELELAILSLVF
jgi:hypothetical protein